MTNAPENSVVDVDPPESVDSTNGQLLLKLRERRAARLAESEPANTEELLNSLIGECRELMRGLADYAQYTVSPDDRSNLSTAAARIALIGAKVGKSVGKLRHPAAPDIRQQRYVVEHRELHALSSAQSLPALGDGAQSKT